MGIIKKLDEYTINKIAAGEVVERPGSIVKELVENSIDGKATSIVIEVKNGGKTYLSVSDNGQGIASDDIPLIFERHATSKIKKLEDIYDIYSFGFRGEAMSSIAAIADVTLTTKQKEEEKGSLMHIKGGKILESKEIGTTTGTRVEVRDVFFNTPARQKFMKSELSEQNHLVDIVEKIALFNTLISFKLVVDEKLVFQTPGNGDMLATIHTIMGKNKAKSMLKLEYNSDKVQIKGYTSKPELTKGNTTDIIFAINKRVIKNRTMIEAVKQAYKTMLMTNKYPICVLDVNILPCNYDVNVHPAKSEVKFEDERAIFNTVYMAIKNLLNSSNLMQEVDLWKEEKVEVEVKKISMEQTSLSMEEPIHVAQEKPTAQEVNVGRPSIQERILQMQSYEVPTIPLQRQVVAESRAPQYEYKEHKEELVHRMEPKRELNIVGQLFYTYILCNDGDTYYMIDQHAAHERLIYESMMMSLANDTVLTQAMLMPIILDLTHKEMNMVLEHIVTFNHLGFAMEQFGDTSIKISSVPLILGQPCNGATINDIIENAMEARSNLSNMREKMLISISCKNAIKAGDPMSYSEMKHLVTQLFDTKIPFTCPHGRPVIIKTTRTDIEKRFKRIL